MKTTAFILNLPWTLLGLLLGILSASTDIRLGENRFVVVVRVKRLWLVEIFMRRRVKGITAGSVILLSDKAEKSTYTHELVHIGQFERAPLVFPFLYYINLIKRGYSKDKYEEEAYRSNNNGHDK